MIKAVGFDLWETLISDLPDLSRAQEELRKREMQRILATEGFSIPAAEIERAYRAGWHRCFELYWALDVDIPAERQLFHFLEQLELHEVVPSHRCYGALEKVYVEAALEHPPVIVDGAEEMLTVLRERGLRVGLISNTGRTPGSVLRELLDRNGLSRFLDVMVFSNEHGECKPRLSIFEKLRGGLGVQFDEMVFVGDHLYVDVHGAQQAGMKAVHFDPVEKGSAVAPSIHQIEVTPDATIRDLRELPRLLEELG